MIRKQTTDILKLKSYTLNNCRVFYEKVEKKFKTPENLMTAIEKIHKDIDLLNKLWWTLNYFSETFDNNRRLRAAIERKLDHIALSAAGSTDKSEAR